MKIIDITLSIGCRDIMGQPIDEAYVLQLMDTYRIDHGVCFHHHALFNPQDGNSKMMQIAAASGGKLGFCAVLDPILGADNLPGTGTLIQRLQEAKPECLRIFHTQNHVALHPFYWQEILEAAETLAMPLILDCKYTADLFNLLPDITQQYPNIKFILIRYGNRNGRNILPLVRQRKNVYFTIERMLSHMLIEEICQAGGSNRLLFGSGYPERCIEGPLGLAIYADISPEEKEMLLHHNWEDMHL